MSEELAPLILPDNEEPSAVRFDALMYGIELASLIDKKYVRARRDLLKKVSAISGVANIPEITAQSGLIHKVFHTDFMDNAKIPDFEGVRNNLRGLMKYLPHDGAIYNTNFTDNILSTEWNESELDSDDLANYKAKAEYYVRHHQHEGVIAKLKGNIPLTAEDVDALERILWSEVGTQEDYEAAFSKKPLGEFVREIVGLDMNAAKQAFGKYANGENLDSRQMYFVNQIVEYIVHNGMMKDLSVLQNAPFTDCGSVVEIFTESAWAEIRQVIERINANASVA